MHEDYRTAIITLTMRRMIGDKNAQLFDEFPAHQKKVRRTNKAGPSSDEIRAMMQGYIKGKETMVKKSEESN